MNALVRALAVRSRRNAFKRHLRIDFYRAMYLYQRAGARKLDALRKLNQTYSAHLPVWQTLANRLHRRLGGQRDLFRSPIAAVAEAGLIQSNLPLADALRDWIPAPERAILASGEDSGNLAGALEMAGRFARQQGGMWAQVAAAFIYPGVLIVGVLGVLYLIAAVMLPAMEVRSTAQFSFLTQFVLGAGELTYNYWWLAGTVPVISAALIVASLSRWKGRWRIKVDRWPPWSIYRRIHGALFLYSFAVLQKSGIPIQSALANLATSANPYIRSRINAAMYSVRQGYNLGESFRHAGHEFPDWEAIPVMESIAALSGSSDALIDYAENWLQDTAKYIEKFTQRANAAARTGVLVWVGLLSMAVLEIISTSFR